MSGRGFTLGSALRYAVGGALLLLVGIAVSFGGPWYLWLPTLFIGMATIVRKGLMFRVGVTRSTDAISCRYVPWFEGNAYMGSLIVPVMGVSAIGMGLQDGAPGWLRFVGIFVLAMTPWFLARFIRMRRRALLVVTPLSVTVCSPFRRAQETNILRDRITAITPKIVRLPSGSEVLLTEILHTADPHGAGTASVLLGPSPAEKAVWVTVKPANLLAGLQTWKDCDPEDPGLLDRVEEILRGQSPAGASGNN